MSFLKSMAVAAIILLSFISACQKQSEEKEEIKTIKIGSVVLIDYAAGFENGTLFDTSIKEVAEKAGILNPNRIYQPAQVTVGQGNIVPGVEKALIGMKESEAKTVTLPPEKAYGIYSKEKIKQVPIEAFGNSTDRLKEGIPIIVQAPQGDISAIIRKVGSENVTLDLNHPLAGKTVTFAIIVRSIS